MRVATLPLVSLLIVPALSTGFLNHGHGNGLGVGVGLGLGIGHDKGHGHSHDGGRPGPPSVPQKPDSDCGCDDKPKTTTTTTTTKCTQTTTKKHTTTKRSPTTTRHVTTTHKPKTTTTHKPKTTTTKKSPTTTTHGSSAPTPCKTIPITKPGDLTLPHIIHFPPGGFHSYKPHWEASCRSSALVHGKISLGFSCAQLTIDTAVVTCITKEQSGVDVGIIIGGKGDLTLPHKVHFPHGHFDSYKHKWEQYCSVSAGIWGHVGGGFSCSKVSATVAIVTCVGKSSGGFDLGLTIGGEVDLSLPHLVHFEHGKFHDYEKTWLKSCAAHLSLFGKASGGSKCSQTSATTAVVICLPKPSGGINVGLDIDAEVDLSLPQLVHFELGLFDSYKKHWEQSCSVYVSAFGKKKGGFSCQKKSSTTAIVTCIGKTSAGFDLGLSIAAGVDLKLPQLVTFERGHFNDYKAHWQKSCAVYAGIFGQTSGRYSCSQLTSTTAVVVCLGDLNVGIGADLGLSIGGKWGMLTPHSVKFAHGRFGEFKKGWQAACSAYAVKFGTEASFSCRQTSATTAIVTCAKRQGLLGNLIGDLTGGLVGHLRLPLA